MSKLIGVDWGTSQLRVARIDANGGAIEERASDRGILSVPQGDFAAVLDETCGDWLADREALVLVCGMAGSRQGWLEAPYCSCPAGFGDIATQLAWIERGRIAIVPGLACEHAGVPDVMRGEETQVFGALALLGLRDATLVLPGTHSKWVSVDNGRIESFATFMTGEFYALLRKHSILARTIDAEDGPFDEAAFGDGVQHALRTAGLLRAAFSARTLALFDRLPAAAGPSYLSGLLIGEELRSHAGAKEVIVVGAAHLAKRYGIALKMLGAGVTTVGSQATWRGLRAIADKIGDMR